MPKINETVHVPFRDCLSLVPKFEALVALLNVYQGALKRKLNRQIICVLNKDAEIERKSVLSLVTYCLGKVPSSTTSLLNYQQ